MWPSHLHKRLPRRKKGQGWKEARKEGRKERWKVGKNESRIRRKKEDATHSNVRDLLWEVTTELIKNSRCCGKDDWSPWSWIYATVPYSESAIFSSQVHNLNICFNTILPTMPHNQNPWDPIKILFSAHGSGLELCTTEVLKQWIEENFSLKCRQTILINCIKQLTLLSSELSYR